MLCCFVEDEELKRYISVWEVDKLYKASDREFVERHWADGEDKAVVDQGARILIPTKNGMRFFVERKLISRRSYCCRGTDYCILFDDNEYVSVRHSPAYDIRVLYTA
jgi:hypothetical protein